MSHTTSGVAAASVALALGAPAGAQAFALNEGAVPSGNPANASVTESIDFGDVDLDGDWDAVFADGGDPGNDQNRIWINVGGLQAGQVGEFVDETATRFPALQDQSRDMEFVDFDSDGDVDLHTANTAQVQLQGNRWWTNVGGLQGGSVGFYADETHLRWVGLGQPGSSIAPTLLIPNALDPETFIDWSCDADFGDLDADGDLDLLQSSYGGAFGGDVPTRIFLNDGAGFFSEHNPSGFQLVGDWIPNGSPGLWCEGTQEHNTTVSDGSRCDVATSALDADVGDHDGDFDLDILHGERDQVPRLFTNRLEETGDLIFRDTTTSAFQPGYSTGGGNYEQEWSDLDADGDLDIYGLNWASQGFGFNDATFRGNGDGTFGSPTVLSGSSSDENEVDFLDYDNDGDLDAIVAGFSGTNSLYRNDHDGSGPGFSFTNVTASEMPDVSGKTTLDIDAADVDNDGDLDFFEANDGYAANRFFENVTQVPDTSAPRVPRIELVSDGAAQSKDDRVRAQVYDNAPYYVVYHHDVRLEVSVDGVPLPSFPMASSGGQVFRGELPGNLVGTIEYRLEAMDGAGNTGSSSTASYRNSGSTGFQGGGSTSSSTGLPATLRSLARPLAGEPIYIVAENVAASTPGFVFVSDSSLPSLSLGDGLILNVGAALVDPIFVVADAAGRSLLPIDPVSPAVAGMTIYLQYFGLDGVGGASWTSSQRLGLVFP